MRTRPQFFDSVREAAQNRWDQLEHDPELGGAWWLLFRQVQNPRHVLSELLQNADDAGATEASVAIEDGCFIFRHNGHDFGEDEFRSLCRFAFSNKRRLLTIGFRGIGFKSVFSLGPRAEVLTPTLAFGFGRQRFTQPEWIETTQSSALTTVRVRIESPETEGAIRSQIETWTRSAVPLLFFQSIRMLRLLDQEIRVEDTGAGPCDRSHKVKLSGLGDAIVFRSVEEPFPPECLEEVRAERGENIELPPCDVVILLSAAREQRLYCVLPTEIAVPLPFSCHAPFVQDPARTAIKDPSMSPTNAWLLGRVGKFAAESLLTWLGRDDLEVTDRAQAYGLLPEATTVNTGLLSGAAGNCILNAFRNRLANQDLLLCADGKLDNQTHTASLPRAPVEAWGADVARALFAPAKQSVLSSEVSSSARAHLEVWKLLEATPIETVFNRLADETKPLPPRPTKLEALAAFWAFSQQHLPAVWSWRDWWRTAAIVPISGRTQLGRAKDMLSSRNPPAGCSSADWQFIIDRAEILDEDWKGLIEWIKEKPEEPPILDGVPCRRFGQKDMAGILDGFRRTKLDQTPSFDQVFAQVAPRIFTTNAPDAAEAIKFVQIAAKLNVTLGATAPVMFCCADGQWRQRSDNLVARSEIDLEYLLPEKWLQRHVISSQYEDGAQPAEIKNWRSWAVNPDKGGLSGFLLPAKHETKAWNLDRSFFQTRSASVPVRKFASSQWYYTDWNWDREIWDHWNRKTPDSANDIWVDVGAAIISSWSSLWDHVITYEVQQYGRNNFHRLDAGDVPATWLYELRRRPCVLDDRGNPRVPAELFRRTPDTLALLDVEPFVQDRWDATGHQRALDRLGVRTQPADAAKLLDRLRALSQVDGPPIGPLRDLYRAIERVLPRLPKEREGEVVAAFAAERIVRTERAWERSSFCFRENPGAIPGVSVLHPDVRDVIGLWEKLKVAPQPSVADALRWFASLPLDQALGDADLKAARQVLSLYPQDAWSREARWLTLQGRVISAPDLRWGCIEQRAVPGLFTSVRSVSADFSMLDGSRLHAAMAAPPRLLESAIERRVSGYDPGSGNAANEEPWLHAVGDVLSRVELGNASETALEADRRAAQRLIRTRWIPSRAVRIQPYLDGVAAGTPSELSTAWIADSLYVNGDSVRAYRSLVQELSRPFAGPAAGAIIHDCVGRDVSWIRAYADAYLKLSDEATQDLRAIAAAADSPQPSSVFPEPAQVSDQTRPERSISISEKAPPPHAAVPTLEQPEKKTPEESAAATSKEPSKLDRLTTFLESRGFQWHEDAGTFIHPDGSFVHKCNGIFMWELVAADRVNPLWLAPTGLSDPDGIEIPAEVWLAAGRCDAVLLAPDSDTFREHHFSALRAEVASQALDLFPAIYRIRISETQASRVNTAGPGGT